MARLSGVHYHNFVITNDNSSIRISDIEEMYVKIRVCNHSKQ